MNDESGLKSCEEFCMQMDRFYARFSEYFSLTNWLIFGWATQKCSSCKNCKLYVTKISNCELHWIKYLSSSIPSRKYENSPYPGRIQRKVFHRWQLVTPTDSPVIESKCRQTLRKPHQSNVSTIQLLSLLLLIKQKLLILIISWHKIWDFIIVFIH